MLTFIISGVVYLVGVAAMLVVRPAFMFTPDGNWKEFGIGKSDDRYTPFPFWLFCIVWALVSYVLVITVKGVSSSSRNSVVQQPMYDSGEAEAVELPKGYYVLNKKATKLSGVPKYVYLGPELASGVEE
jgi:hypothetical protein